MVTASLDGNIGYCEKKEYGMSGWIRLNVGGKRFMTTRDTLTRPYPNSFFSKLLTSELSSAKDDTGAILVDGDCFYFREILNYLRRGTFSIIPYRLEGLRAEAEYYHLDAMVAQIDLQLIFGGMNDDKMKKDKWDLLLNAAPLEKNTERKSVSNDNSPERLDFVFGGDGKILQISKSGTKLSIKEYISTPNDLEIISLNVGGEVFMETRQILTFRHPNSFIAKLVNGKLQSDKDENGAILIDADPDYFRQILNYLTFSIFDCLPSRLNALKAEADFFGLESMMCHIQYRLDVERIAQNEDYTDSSESEYEEDSSLEEEEEEIKSEVKSAN